MALNGLVTAEAPTSYGLTPLGVRPELILGFPVAASTSISAFDFVYLDSGYIKKAAAVDAKVIGIAMESKDNSSGSAGALHIAVCVKGIVEQDALTASATHTTLALGTKVYLAPAVSSYCAVAQAVSASSASSAVHVGKCLDNVTAPSAGSQISKVRILYDFTDLAKDWA